MSSQAEAWITYSARNMSRSAYIGSAVILYGIIALGYQLGFSQATHPTVATMLCFTLLQIGYGIVLWRLPRGKHSLQRRALKTSLLTVLVFACSLLTVIGLGLDWPLYLVTIAAYFMAYSVRTAIVFTVLLYLLLGISMAIRSKWNWPDALTNWLNLLFNFVFVTIFLCILHILGAQKTRAEQLLHQLEQSNTELEQAHQQLQQFAQEVEELTIIHERTRLAREIHDTLGHYLSLLNIQLGTMSKLYACNQADLGAEIAEARQLASQAIQEVRHAVTALRPTSITTLSLSEALAQLGSEFANSNEEMQLTLDLERHLPAISQEVQMAFYRAAQEALTNTLKHAKANKVLLRLRYEDTLLELVVLDNGTGMAKSEEQHPDGFGLTGLHERFDAIGGQVTHGSDESGGYRVSVLLHIAPPSCVEKEQGEVRA